MYRRYLPSVIAILTFARVVAAQTPAVISPCDGHRISSIDINPERPGFSGSAGKWRAIAHSLGLHHTTTRTGVIRAYMLVGPGDDCSDIRLAESQRVLRGLPFLADARVIARADTGNLVVVEVRTVDEVPVLANASFRHGTPSALTLGNENVAGLGMRIVIGGERDDVYRGARRLELADYGLFGNDVFGRTEIARDRLGGHVDVSLSHPFLSSLQRTTWQASYRDGRDYPVIVRPVDNGETVPLATARWSAGVAVRGGIGPIVTLLGPVVLGSRLDRRGGPLIISDSGPVAVDDSALAQRFAPYTATRVGALLGARHVDFITRQGLDALFATQDVMVGWQVGGIVTPSVTSRQYRDILAAPDIYLGGAVRRVFAFTDVEGEFTEGTNGTAARSTIINARAMAYFTATSRFVIQARNNFSVLDQARIPTQLSLGDPIGGPRGYLGSRLVGGRRNLTSLELRWATPNAFHRGDLGAAVFADAASIWPGDVPYGVTASRQSVGFSVLAAYPTKSKRLYRLDIAVPVQKDRGRGVEFRFTSGDASSRNNIEPFDVTQARQAPTPVSLVTWPIR